MDTSVIFLICVFIVVIVLIQLSKSPSTFTTKIEKFSITDIAKQLESLIDNRIPKVVVNN